MSRSSSLLWLKTLINRQVLRTPGNNIITRAAGGEQQLGGKEARAAAKSPLLLLRSFAAAPRAMTPRIIDAIKQDHRELESYYDKIVNSNNPEEQTRFQNQFTWELARHAVAEELIVYPAFEKYLKDGNAMADKDRKEHQVVCISPTYTIICSDQR